MSREFSKIGDTNMQQQTGFTFFLDTVKYEINFWSYWIYLALLRGHLKREDPVSKISQVPFTEEDIKQIREMERRDVLELNRVKLFATKVSSTRYAFYFAEAVEHAMALHQQWYGIAAHRWHDVYKQMRHEVVKISKCGTIASFWELKDGLVELPSYVGELDIGELRRAG